ncbi:unnamed protein product [Urochloa humidicola]
MDLTSTGPPPPWWHEPWPPRWQGSWPRLPGPPRPLHAPVFTVTVDPQGFFGITPYLRRCQFRSVGEALDAVEAFLARRRALAAAWVLTEGGWVQQPEDDGQPRLVETERPPGTAEPAVPAVAIIYTRRVPLDGPRFSPWSSWEYYVTLKDGLFYAHPPEVGGPFHSLGEAAAAIKCHRTLTSTIQLSLMKGYYFILKEGLFHVHPDGCGGPYKWLDDATDAIACHRVWRQKENERNRRAKQFLDELDPDVYISRMMELRELILSGGDRNSNCPKPEKKSWMEEIVASLEPKGCDPAILEEADRFERILAEKELVENGMKWMENEVLQAFKIYEASSRYPGPEYEFVQLDQQCLIRNSCSKSYHHYNFTMKKKTSHLGKKVSWDYQLFFAEVKPTTEGKQFICYPLQHDDNGHCFGCRNVGIDLRHPTSGGYEKGEKGSGFPFDTFSVSDH